MKSDNKQHLSYKYPGIERKPLCEIKRSESEVQRNLKEHTQQISFTRTQGNVQKEFISLFLIPFFFQTSLLDADSDDEDFFLT